MKELFGCLDLPPETSYLPSNPFAAAALPVLSCQAPSPVTVTTA